LGVPETPRSLPERTGSPLPRDVRPPVRILDERALLMGNRRSACTYQTPPSGNGHRWRAFTLGAPTDGLAELWVIDVTQAAAGDVPTCDGNSPGCIRLSGSVAVLSATVFDGDTLIFHADPISGPNEDFLGPIYAWRPGWSGARQISSGRGIACSGQEHSAAAACFDDPGGDPTNRDSVQVRVGYLVDEAGGALPSFGRWPLRGEIDSAWAAAFSPDGSIFVLSSVDSIGKKQTLRTVPTADVGQSPQTLPIDGVDWWNISNDGQMIYFIRQLAQQLNLFAAEFPSGAGERVMESGVLSFSLIGARPEDQAVEYVKDLGGSSGAFNLLRDHSGATPKTIFTYDDILDGDLVSADLRYTVWMDVAFRGVVIRNDDGATCPLDIGDEPAVFEPAFLDGAGLMFWQEISRDDPFRHDAFFAPPDRCRPKQRFGQGIDFYTPIGDRGLVFADERDGSMGPTTLKYVATSPDGAGLDALGPVRVQEGVTGPVIFVGGDPPILIYPAVDPASGSAGLYVFGPVPL
jgi:hypothetical protein